MFDDGSRIISEEASNSNSNSSSSNNSSRPENVSIDTYYEIDRIAKEIQQLLPTLERKNADDGWDCRVAMQFPDSLLRDASEVCWKLESALLLTSSSTSSSSVNALVFVLGDTTFGSCCPDEINALHLNADVLVHFGHACLSPAATLPVIYSFGVVTGADGDVGGFDVHKCIDDVLAEMNKESIQRILLLYQVQYHHAIEAFQTQLSERGDKLVVAGQIPSTAISPEDKDDDQPAEGETSENDNNMATTLLGGLQIPANLDLSTFTLLFVGDSMSSRQFVNTMLHLISLPETRSPSNYWFYNPPQSTLETSPPSTLQRQLNRRFFLTQKARDASVFGILVGTLSQRHFTKVVGTLQKTIKDADRACYTFAVGKINPAKLANFGEIECFVLVACSENSLLENEREMHVPVITPLELDMALGNTEWGDGYSLDYNDFLKNKSSAIRTNEEATTTTTTGGADLGDDNNNDDDADAPYFSLVTGKYEESKKVVSGKEDTDLSALPGKGQLTAYDSQAVEFFKQREYQGLQTDTGKTEVKAAIPGQSGIASDYGDR